MYYYNISTQTIFNLYSIITSYILIFKSVRFFFIFIILFLNALSFSNSKLHSL